MLATLIPLFDHTMNVCAYSVFAQKDNFLLNPRMLGVGRYDGAANVVAFEILDSMGLETMTGDKNVFVEMNNISIFADIAAQCSVPHDRIVLLVDNELPPDEKYTARLKELKEDKYKLAIRRLPVVRFEEYRPVLSLMDYILLDHKKIDISKAKVYFSKVYPNIKLIAVNVDSQEDYDRLKEGGGYDLYEGEFFRMPVKKGAEELAPLKVNYLELLKVVNDEDFDLSDAASVIERDPALVVSLLAMVNRMTVNSGITSVKHAAAMLGQKELKRWINTAATKELCVDRPSEILRLSMIRARFAENLAPVFKLASQSSELFLMGLFSVLDVIIEKPMAEALDMVRVSSEIQRALLKKEGSFAAVYDFLVQYENASWQEVSRQMVVGDIDMDTVYKAYVDALCWFRDLFEE